MSAARNGLFHLPGLLLLAGGLVACDDGADPAPPRDVTVRGVLAGSGAAGSTGEVLQQLRQGLDASGLAIVALGTDSSTERFPVDADGSFALALQPDASYTLNVLDTVQESYVGSFLYRTGDNLSLALRVGHEDLDLGSCQLVQGEVWCSNGFFDAPQGSAALQPVDGFFGGFRMTIAEGDGPDDVVERLLGGREIELEAAPNPLNKYHIAMFNKTNDGCDAPLFGTAERIDDELYMYLSLAKSNASCSATVRYQAVCTLEGASRCNGFLRVDVTSSGADCRELPAIHVARPFSAHWHSPDVLSCKLPTTCSQHTDCPSGACDSAVNFCAAASRDQALRIFLFDVGNGQSLLAITPSGTSVLMDAGRPSAGRLTAAVLRRLVPRLDYMVISHFDDDHGGGAVPIFLGPDGAPGRRGIDDDGQNGIDDEAEVGAPNSDDLLPSVVLDRGLTPMPSGYEQYERLLGERRREAIAGEELDLGGGVTLTILTVNGRIKGGAAFAVKDENERSVGLILRHGEFSFVNLGDLPGGGIGSLKMEQAVGPQLVADAPVDVHLLSHHGSAASSPIDLLRALKPRTALVSVGDSDRCGAGFNSYGLPAQRVLDDLAAVGGVRRVYQTQAGGASFSGACVVESGQTFPRDYRELDPAFAYSVLTIEAYPETFRISGLTFDDHYNAVGCSGDACPTCPVGYLDNPERPGTCIVDPCVPDPCSGHGVCSFVAVGQFACACADRFAGTTCEACAEGYAGEECAQCAPGFWVDPLGSGDCVVDPCQPDPCSGHGTCSRPGAGLFACSCEGHFDGERCDACAPGYAGEGCDGCAPGYLPDPGATTICVADPCSPDPCSGHGECLVLPGGAASCRCATGYTGPACAACADGFVPDPGQVTDCVLDRCSPDPCSGHGNCAVLPGGGYLCACAGHFVGEHCDRCAEGYEGADCNGCAPGYLADPGAPGSCLDDPCAPDPCSGHGGCRVLAGGGAACDCVEPWAGLDCADCASGYAGAECAECAPGYVRDPGRPARCLDDPCQPDPCSGHGTCQLLADGAHRCDCEVRWTGAGCTECAVGYTGESCADCSAGYIHDPVQPLTCLDDPCAPDPCSGHGTCGVLPGGAASCACLDRWSGPSCDACLRGYSGATCESCAEGYLPDPSAPDECIVDPCLPDPCQGRGLCSIGEDGGARCACTAPFAGSRCGECITGYSGEQCDRCAAGWHALEGGCVADVTVDACQLLTAPFWSDLDEVTPIHGLVWTPGGEQAGPQPGLIVSACFSEAPIAYPVIPAELVCEDAGYLGEEQDGERYGLGIVFAAPATWRYVLVVSGDGGFTWTACDLDGTADGPLAEGLASTYNVPNGGVERWAGEPPQPEGFLADEGVLVEHQTERVHSGTSAARLTRLTTSNADSDFSGPEQPIQGGGSYNVSVWFWDDDPNIRANVVVTWYDAARSVITTSYGTTYTTDQPQWQQITRAQPMIAPAAAAFVRIGTRLYVPAGGQPTGGAVLLDDVAMIEQ